MIALNYEATKLFKGLPYIITSFDPRVGSWLQVFVGEINNRKLEHGFSTDCTFICYFSFFGLDSWWVWATLIYIIKLSYSCTLCRYVKCSIGDKIISSWSCILLGPAWLFLIYCIYLENQIGGFWNGITIKSFKSLKLKWWVELLEWAEFLLEEITLFLSLLELGFSF